MGDLARFLCIHNYSAVHMMSVHSDPRLGISVSHISLQAFLALRRRRRFAGASHARRISITVHSGWSSRDWWAKKVQVFEQI